MSGSSGPAPSDVVRARLRDLARQARAADADVHAGGAEGVHDLRVAMRRTRSLLRTFRALLGADTTEHTEKLRAELRWAAGELSAVRDLEVVHGALFAAVADESLPASVGERLERHREETGAAARAQVSQLLGSTRYAQVLDELDRLVDTVGWDAVTPKSARRALRKDWRRLRRRARAVETLAPGADPEATLHEVRKAAKRARYAAELARPVLGKKKAKKKAKKYKMVQTVLGEHQDSVVAAETLRTLGARAGSTPGENGFAFGLLYGLELQAAQRARADAADLTTT